MDDFSWLFANQTLITDETMETPIRKDVWHENIVFINGLRKQALNDLIVELPPPDTMVFILSNGSGGTFKHGENPKAFEYGHFVPVLCQMAGTPCVVHISTWTMNKWHSQNLLQMLDNQEIARLSIVTDPYFLQRESVVANGLVEGLMERGQKFRAFKNHVKALCIEGQKAKVSVLSSANLSSQPRAENYVLSTNAALHDWLVHDFFEVMLNATS